jgi:hypothetical protein
VLNRAGIVRLKVFGRFRHPRRAAPVQVQERIRHGLDLNVAVAPAKLLQGADEVCELVDLLRAGEQHFRFNINEIGRHGDKFAGDLQVHSRQRVKIPKVLLQDERDAHVRDLDPVFAEQLQDQFQRTDEILHFALRPDNALEPENRVFHGTSVIKTASQGLVRPAPQ